MKKKLFLLLLIVALTAFVFTGCTPPAEGEGEGEGEIEGVLVEIDGQYEENGRIYVKGGNRDITVTFPTPVTGVVQVDLTDCTGNYSRGSVALFPNADRTIWEGSVTFPCKVASYTGGLCDTPVCSTVDLDCCATTVTIISGACDRDTCIVFPVIVDCEAPTAAICVEADCCVCEGIELTFESTVSEGGPCAADKDDCYDKCSGIGGWSLNIYCGNPFDKCCEVPCAEPVFSASGTDCPIEVTTSCLNCKTYAVEGEADQLEMRLFGIFTIWDNVGNTTEVGRHIYVVYNTDEDGNCESIDYIDLRSCEEIKEDGAGEPCIDCWNLEICKDSQKPV
ncbi:MAG: hypothetical protein RBT05_11050 [Bacteroidales bacterium]|jgi:hypothetical protein|nr:hypothetical protein [Bacteroidales bacterium]